MRVSYETEYKREEERKKRGEKPPEGFEVKFHWKKEGKREREPNSLDLPFLLTFVAILGLFLTAFVDSKREMKKIEKEMSSSSSLSSFDQQRKRKEEEEEIREAENRPFLDEEQRKNR